MWWFGSLLSLLLWLLLLWLNIIMMIIIFTIFQVSLLICQPYTETAKILSNFFFFSLTSILLPVQTPPLLYWLPLAGEDRRRCGHSRANGTWLPEPLGTGRSCCHPCRKTKQLPHRLHRQLSRRLKDCPSGEKPLDFSLSALLQLCFVVKLTQHSRKTFAVLCSFFLSLLLHFLNPSTHANWQQEYILFSLTL